MKLSQLKQLLENKDEELRAKYGDCDPDVVGVDWLDDGHPRMGISDIVVSKDCCLIILMN